MTATVLRRALVVLVAGAACRHPARAPSPPPFTPAAIAHGGVGSPPSRTDGCRKAVDAALAALEAGADPLDAAVAGVVVLEDDPRFNAGTGSRIRIDGQTIQMDAAVMDSRGRFGAVGAIERVQNPVRIARAVAETPHLVLVGDGATRFARAIGVPRYDPATPAMRAATAKILRQLRRADPKLPRGWRGFDWRRHWNFERTLEQAGLRAGSDTVGVAVRSRDGRFAVALSTGGTSITLRGRMGDVPVLGAGLYAGPYGAAAATGSGERIVEATLARRVHDWLARGTSARDAARRAVEALRGLGDIGIIVLGPREMVGDADRPMAWAARELGSTLWLGTTP